MRRRVVVATVTVVLGTLLGACSTSSPDATSAPETQELEVMSWWTSGSEHAALEVLFDAFTDATAGVRVKDGSIAGGAGSAVQVVLASRLREGDPPDVWQTFVGESTRASVSRSRLADVSAAYTAPGLAEAIPTALLDAVTVDGKQYGVSTGAHRSNMLWFNPAVLAKAGVAAPTAPYPLDRFLADLKTVQDSGATGLCLGGKDRFTAAELLENVLLGTIGTTGWDRVTADRFDWGGREARTALATFRTITDAADPAAAGQTWDQAIRKLGDGGCAFASMNDSAYGELESAGATPGQDFGQVPFPGTDDSFLAVVDTFVVARDATNLRNALQFVTLAGDKDTMLAFNKVKGSVPTRTDVDVSSLPPYQQQAAKALQDRTILLSITHGEAMTPAFQEGFYDATQAFLDDPDPKTFRTTLTDAVTRAEVPVR